MSTPDTSGDGTVVRSTFDMGTAQPTFLISNGTQKSWLTVWNTGSGPIAIASPQQIVGALRSRSFYVVDDDPILAQFTWGQRNPTIANQPGQAVRKIAYALADFPLADLNDAEIYSSPSLLVAGTTLGNQQTTITPNAGEVYTHIDLAFTNAQAAGAQQELVDANYGQGLTTQALFPPTGSSRQMLEVYGPASIVVACGSPTAQCDWQVFGVANVVR